MAKLRRRGSSNGQRESATTAQGHDGIHHGGGGGKRRTGDGSRKSIHRFLRLHGFLNRQGAKSAKPAMRGEATGFAIQDCFIRCDHNVVQTSDPWPADAGATQASQCHAFYCCTRRDPAIRKSAAISVCSSCSLFQITVIHTTGAYPCCSQTYLGGTDLRPSALGPAPPRSAGTEVVPPWLLRCR